MIGLEVFIRGNFITFRELLVYFEFRLVFTVRHVFVWVFLPLCSAWRQAKVIFVAEGHNSSLLCATCFLNLQHCILLRDKLVTKVVICATDSFNLQSDSVTRQFEEKCCPYCITRPIKSPYFLLPNTVSTQGYLVLSPDSLASRDPDGSPSNSTIDIYDLMEK